MDDHQYRLLMSALDLLYIQQDRMYKEVELCYAVLDSIDESLRRIYAGSQNVKVSRSASSAEETCVGNSLHGYTRFGKRDNDELRSPF